MQVRVSGGIAALADRARGASPEETETIFDVVEGSQLSEGVWEVASGTVLVSQIGDEVGDQLPRDGEPAAHLEGREQEAYLALAPEGRDPWSALDGDMHSAWGVGLILRAVRGQRRLALTGSPGSTRASAGPAG